MKEASGELSMTVITIIVVGALLAFFTAVLWPNIQDAINNQWDQSTNGGGVNDPDNY